MAYTYDLANNITAITNTADATRSQTFGYDELNRLTSATGIYGALDYSYDANGNRLTSVIDTHVQTYSYDTVSHHLLQTVNGGTIDYIYDANGNTTSNTDKEFIYGNNNRLKEAQIAGSPIVTYIYNGKGERVKKQGTGTTLYYYDQSGQLIAELDATGATLREYLYVDGQPLAYVTNNTVHYIHTDHLGTPQVITDQNQNITWAADYEPFGQTTITTETVSYNLRFPGQYFDAETGLHYNMRRYYSPDVGRYITSDPIGIGPSLNTYLYVGANPLRYYDSLGLFSEDFIDIMKDLGSKAIGDWFKDLFVDEVMQGAILKCANSFTCAITKSPLYTENVLAKCIEILSDLNIPPYLRGAKDSECAGGCKGKIEEKCKEDPQACKFQNPPPFG